MLFLALLLSVVSAEVPILGRTYWEKTAKEELEASLKMQWNTGIAKNVIIFIGDGMGPSTITAARIYKSGERGYLSWEQFPHVGALKTYAEDKTVTDSAASATSMFTGVKVNYNVLGLEASVKENDCQAAQNESYHLTSLATLAQAAGKFTGIVTTARVTHATPAAMYARSAQRDWECGVPDYATNCKDIARQMVEDLPAKNFNVILGGGQAMLQHNITHEWDIVDNSCVRTDGLDLIKRWADDKFSRGFKYKVVNNTRSLLDVDPSNTDYLLGIFAPSHMKFDYERDRTDAGAPSLEQMTLTALQILMKNKKGFLLMVEAEHVDLAHHRGRARKSLHEVLQLSDTVNATMDLLSKMSATEETLVIVTSDHSHTLSISGYPQRGRSILGIADTSKADGIPFTTLSYANGPVSNYHFFVNKSSVSRTDPSKENTSDWEYGHQVGVPNDKNTHGGQDVFIYAKGPYAHLFHHMHEQNYVASVVKYAAKIGEYSFTGSGANSIFTKVVFLLQIISLLIIFNVY